MMAQSLQRALIAIAVGLFFTGCGNDSSKAPLALSEEEIPAVVTKAFSGSDKEGQDVMRQYVNDIKSHDYGGAFEELQQLFHVHGLTKSQNEILARAAITTSQKLQDAAASGDTGAVEVLRTFRSNK